MMEAEWPARKASCESRSCEVPPRLSGCPVQIRQMCDVRVCERGVPCLVPRLFRPRFSLRAPPLDRVTHRRRPHPAALDLASPFAFARRRAHGFPVIDPSGEHSQCGCTDHCSIWCLAQSRAMRVTSLFHRRTPCCAYIWRRCRGRCTRSARICERRTDRLASSCC